MAQSMKNIIEQLRSQGFVIEAYKRKDGGYLIKSINGVKYQAAKGNEAARRMVGSQLSVRKTKQLKSITPTSAKAAKLRKAPKPKKPPLPSDLKKEIQDVQKLFRKNVSELGTKTTVKTKSIRYIMETEGEQRAREALAKAKRYAEGYAYIENVNAVLDRIQAMINNSSDKIREVLQEIHTKINQKKEVFLEDWMNQVLNLLYEFDKLSKAQKSLQAAKKLRDDIFRIIGA